jgi:hypothetical protein
MTQTCLGDPGMSAWPRHVWVNQTKVTQTKVTQTKVTQTKITQTRLTLLIQCSLTYLWLLQCVITYQNNHCNQSFSDNLPGTWLKKRKVQEMPASLRYKIHESNVSKVSMILLAGPREAWAPLTGVPNSPRHTWRMITTPVLSLTC